MDPVDYGDTSEEDTSEQPTKSSSMSSRKLKREQEQMTQSDIINNNLDNLASLIPILQSHQQLIDAESTSMSQLAPTAISQPKKHKHTHSSHSTSNPSHSHASAIKKSNKKSMQMNNNNIMPHNNNNSAESIAYFILRSNNEENVRTSMEKCVWATQPQNEPVLNDAFEQFDKVILFFSVCRSMHFQGVAQMTSRIGHRKSRSLWEADPHTRGKTKWGGTFTVVWLRIFDLAFDQTNNICNPWNGNRPVKFSRDGQPVPHNVGHQLTHLFDIGVMEFGQGSAILRKPIRIGNLQDNIIAVQKIFVNGRFVPATDIQTAQNMVVLEEESVMLSNSNHSNANHHHNHSHVHMPMHANNGNNENEAAQHALNRLVSSLQQQQAECDANGHGDVLNIASLSKSHRDRSRDKRVRNRSRNRKRDRDRDRDRSRDRNRKRRRRSDGYYESYSSESGNSKESKDRKRRSKDKKHRRSKKDRHDPKTRRREQENVINSLWTQINLQQALIAQSGLYNSLNGDASTNNIASAAPTPTPTYPSNRGGVY